MNANFDVICRRDVTSLSTSIPSTSRPDTAKIIAKNQHKTLQLQCMLFHCMTASRPATRNYPICRRMRRDSKRPLHSGGRHMATPSSPHSHVLSRVTQRKGVTTVDTAINAGDEPRNETWPGWGISHKVHRLGLSILFDRAGILVGQGFPLNSITFGHNSRYQQLSTRCSRPFTPAIDLEKKPEWHSSPVC